MSDYGLNHLLRRDPWPVVGRRVDEDNIILVKDGNKHVFFLIIKL